MEDEEIYFINFFKQNYDFAFHLLCLAKILNIKY